jgi:anti-sigma factor RsiW
MTADGQPIGESDLHAYVDGLLDADRKKSVEAYLAEHSEWAARVSAWQSGRDKLRRAFALESESSVPASLNIARLLELRADRRWAPARVAAGLVLALATGAAAGWMARGAQTPTGLTGLTLQAASVHRMFASDPGFPATFRAADMADLVAYLGQRFGRPITPPDLSRSGYRLMGARIVATEDGAGCIFVYEGDNGSRISLFMRPMHDQCGHAPCGRGRNVRVRLGAPRSRIQPGFQQTATGFAQRRSDGGRRNGRRNLKPPLSPAHWLTQPCDFHGNKLPA